ncbi:hypothetical protein TSA66_15475 [Noviherbaspirillum autotrophicum]|uniref:Uncharacterized protein n=2 Tax=Noviherbaspirillum autotrophicum TaxID=709839 RepID=A0A0C1YMZ4_9BURK|nr:hypothetical protein TSA66_15475 [Noviherbaspirillum autotrophicum]
MAVLDPGEAMIARGSNGSNGSTPEGSFQKFPNIVDLTGAEEHAIRAWLAHIGETDKEVIGAVLEQCRGDAQARSYFLRWADETVRPALIDDDRRRCDQCANLTPRGLCLAARRGEIVASRVYEPVTNIPQRCEGYMPGADDMDRRPGWERWPGLARITGNPIAE